MIAPNTFAPFHATSTASYTYTVEKFKPHTPLAHETLVYRNWPGTPAEVRPAVYLDDQGNVTQDPTGYLAQPAMNALMEIASWNPRARIDTTQLDEQGFGTLTIRHKNGAREVWTFTREHST